MAQVSRCVEAGVVIDKAVKPDGEVDSARKHNRESNTATRTPI